MNSQGGSQPGSPVSIGRKELKVKEILRQIAQIRKKALLG
jgi:hypothetical protein